MRHLWRCIFFISSLPLDAVRCCNPVIGFSLFISKSVVLFVALCFRSTRHESLNRPNKKKTKNTQVKEINVPHQHWMLTQVSSQVVSPLISNMIRTPQQFIETRCAEEEKKFRAETQKKYFDIDPKRKHIKRHFYTCLLQVQKAEMVSRENKTESLFLPTIALSYKNLLESLASPQCHHPLPSSPLPLLLFISLFSPFRSRRQDRALFAPW